LRRMTQIWIAEANKGNEAVKKFFTLCLCGLAFFLSTEVPQCGMEADVLRHEYG
jgi:hypothetical protein